VGDSIYLFVEGPVNPGLWTLALNNNTPSAYLPAYHADGGYTFFNDTNYTPNPNNTMVGDINGDGVDDLVVNGKDGNGHTMFLGRNTDTTGSAGDLLQPAIGGIGWDQNWSPHWSPLPAEPDFYASFIGDVNGDGKDDSVVVRTATGVPGLVVWNSNHADAQGLEGIAPVTSASWFDVGVGNVGTPLMGDFNGDGAVDTANQNATGLVLSQVSTLGTGLDPLGLTMWGNMGFAANHIVTLVGDINGDGIDDIVQVDDRNSNGIWTWVAGITGVNGGIPAGYEIALGGPHSWASPFTLDAASTKAVPLLADINNDGYDDLVLYEEYDVGGNIWSRMLAAYTVGGTLTGSTYNEATFFDWVTLLGSAYSDITPVVGNAHLDYCDTLVGDLNNDCRVNLKDFAVMAEFWLN